jgi:hypothetical protein
VNSRGINDIESNSEFGEKFKDPLKQEVINLELHIKLLQNSK